MSKRHLKKTKFRSTPCINKKNSPFSQGKSISNNVSLNLYQNSLWFQNGRITHFHFVPWRIIRTKITYQKYAIVIVKLTNATKQMILVYVSKVSECIQDRRVLFWKFMTFWYFAFSLVLLSEIIDKGCLFRYENKDNIFFLSWINRSPKNVPIFHI